MTDLFLVTYDILIGFNRGLEVSVQTEKKFKFSKLRSSLTALFSSSIANSWSLLIALFFIKTITQTLLCFCCYAVSSCLYYKADISASCGSEWYWGGELRAITLGVFWNMCCRTLMFLTFPVWPSFWTWRCAMMNLCIGWKAVYCC